jgi:RNA polymerase sigma factor (sigma-70 family)
VKTTESQTLLAAYTRKGSEAAFRELVTRYLNLVYGSALRLVAGDTHLAEDVAQMVFVDLARKACTLPGDVMLGGWLHRDTCFVAAKVMRGERRRQAREREAVQMNAQPDHSAANLAQVASVLDEAINQLGAADRTVILLRFFEQRDLRAVGLTLGVSEDTAQKRVSRALEKLRALLGQRGVGLSAGVLGATLTTQGGTAAPAGLAVVISEAALAQAAAGGGLALTFLKLLTMSKLKFGVLGAILFVGAAVPGIVYLQSGPAQPAPDATVAQVEPTPAADAPAAAPGPETPAVKSARRTPSAVRSQPATPAPTAPALNAKQEATNGQRLSAAQAQELEIHLAQEPNDLAARCQLLGFYFLAQRRSQPAHDARLGHIQWLIQQHPELDLGAYGSLDPMLDGDAYAQAKATWLQQVQANPQNVAILGNAAQFFTLQDRATAEDLLKQAQALEPTNPAWFSQMAGLYALDGLSAAPAAARQAAVKALEQMEYAQANTTGDQQRFHNLDQLAQMALDAGELEKARTYAASLLQQAGTPQAGWNYGDAIYRGNLVLGRIALRSGNLAEAEQYLLAAGQTTGSPKLDSFGPNMTLAKELLEQGQKDAVLQYFQLCGRFWKSDKLAAWTQQINQGVMPDFGGNLAY